MARRLIVSIFILALITLLPSWSRGLAAGLVLLWWAAHIPLVARGLWLRVGQPRRDITRWALPGLILEENGNGSEEGGTDTEEVILGSSITQNEETELVSTVILLVSRHNLDAQHAAQLLSVLRNESGNYILSANAIRDIVGGNNAKVHAWVRAMRPETQQPAPRQSNAPPDGWTYNSDGYLIKIR